MDDLFASDWIFANIVPSEKNIFKPPKTGMCLHIMLPLYNFVAHVKPLL